MEKQALGYRLRPQAGGGCGSGAAEPRRGAFRGAGFCGAKSGGGGGPRKGLEGTQGLFPKPPVSEKDRSASGAPQSPTRKLFLPEAKKAQGCAQILLFLTGILLCASCGTGGAYFDVFQGNYEFGRGMYQAAIVSYMRALESYGEGRDRAWVEYNLGCAYYSLGEASSALAVWERAGLSEDRELLFHVAYNKGRLFAELGRSREACGEFRQALRLDPAAVDAKVNLELALRKLASGAGGAPRQGPGQSPGQEKAGDDAGRILDYVKRKDATKWVATDELAGSVGDDW